MQVHALILDLVHGGDIITEILVKEGIQVTCVDVYGIASSDLSDRLKSIGADVCREVPEGSYDLLISPVHCPDRFLKGAEYAERKTFHEIVGELIDDDRFRIEVTGVKGKTSCCYLLAHILSTAGMRIYLHSSRGDGPWTDGTHRIDGYSSIAPTSLLRLPEGDYDIMITEVSLGGSGRADISVITNLAEDYGIAGNTRKASDAKASILSENVNIVSRNEVGIWSRYGDHKLTTYGGAVQAIGKPEFGKPLTVHISYFGDHTVDLDPSYLSVQYIQTIEVVIEVCEHLGIPAEAVTEGLRTFKGVPGRGEIEEKDGILYVRERNPGISALSIRNTLNLLDQMGALESAAVIVDPVSRKVCDKLDSESIRAAVSEYDVDLMFTDGEGRRPEIPDGTRFVVEFIKEGYQ